MSAQNQCSTSKGRCCSEKREPQVPKEIRVGSRDGKAEQRQGDKPMLRRDETVFPVCAVRFASTPDFPNTFQQFTLPPSLPRGSVDRNCCQAWRTQRPAVAPSRERGSKHRVLADALRCHVVAPSRERGSKHKLRDHGRRCPSVAPSRERGSKPSGSDAWHKERAVAPSRERGSKQQTRVTASQSVRSLPRGSVDRNSRKEFVRAVNGCRSLAGAWIETSGGYEQPRRTVVAPSRERGSKH